MNPTKPVATVVITTKNRKDELRVALESVLAQTVSLEILVIDDGSTDGTTEFVRARFPGMRVVRSEVSHGLVVQRNRAARLATTPYIFSIDDDAAYSTPHVVEQTLPEFEAPRIGAVAIPYIEPLKQNRLMQQAPSGDRIWITDAFIGTAHALRRDVFLQIHGYRETLIHQGEERDYCIRMLEHGWLTRLGCSDPILHYESPRRDLARIDYFERRNDILFAWHCVPLLWFPLHLAATSVNGIRGAFKARRFYSMAAGMFAGYVECFRRWSERAPVSQQAYVLSRRLKKNGPLAMDDVVTNMVQPASDSLSRPTT
jgi:glycosyltransferase involved in cell wall biosynthesis